MKKLLNRLAILTLMTPAVGFALGVGDIEVMSKLNEPLRAEIELIYSDSSEPASTEVTLASAEDFERVGLDRGMVPVPLEFTVVRNDQGNYVIEVTSDTAVTEPFLNFLIEVDWETGRLLREYVVLLDPPVTAPAERAVEVTPVPEPGEAPVTEMEEEAEEPARPEETTPPTVSRPTATGMEGGTYGPVSRGETLWEISRDWRPNDDVSINQMMVLLLRMNPEGFYDDNINALKEGAILRLPDQSEFDALSKSVATAQVKDQNEIWNAYVRSRTGREVPTISDAGAEPEYDVSRTAADDMDDESRLEIVPPGDETAADFDRPGGVSEEQVEELRQELTRAREDLISAQQENTELQDRVAELESLISSMERAISLKDASLADLQTQLEEARQAGDGQPIQTYPDDVDTGLAAEDDFGAEPAATDAQDLGAEPVDTGDFGAEPSQTDTFGTPQTDTIDTGTVEPISEPEPVETESAGAAPPPTPAVTRPPREEPGLLSNPLVWGGAAAVVVLLAGGAFFFYRRRQAAGDEEYEIMGEYEEEYGEEYEADYEEEAPPPAPPEPAAASPDEEHESVESLEEAIRENPDDPQNHLALLRRHYADNDSGSFVAAAEAMRERIGDNHPAWMEVKAMGANIASDSDLFADESDDMDFELEGSEVDVDDQQTRMLDTTGEGDLDLGGLDVDGETGEHAGVDEEQEDEDLDFDLDLESEPDAEEEAAAEEPEEEEDLGLDFDLEEDESETAPTAGEAAAEGEDEDVLGDLDLNLDEEAEESDEESLDLDDLGLDIDTEETPASEVAEEGEGEEDHTEFDLEAFDSDQPETGDRSEMDTAELELDLEGEDEAEADDLADLELDDLDLEEGEGGEDDSAGTKLDLAKAYIDMGDPDGARGMLEEVIEEGDDEQKAEAQSLLDDLKS